ncbi:MAG: hypothetical protein JKY94_00585 [Rhodobacteraceae bacterium]|nr:hypothetical protein [Paracoccaceae bacterium]
MAIARSATPVLGVACVPIITTAAIPCLSVTSPMRGAGLTAISAMGIACLPGISALGCIIRPVCALNVPIFAPAMLSVMLRVMFGATIFAVTGFMSSRLIATTRTGDPVNAALLVVVGAILTVDTLICTGVLGRCLSRHWHT